MPTPAIQTLRTDAQQVLNLDSISAVRSVVAATLANANAGTPLNPNLTTQQLWNEFYQIITQPKSDIESIIANQLMKFLYAPPAPGGVGANGQVIFNDGGVLAGDPQFLWNKTTNLLTVTGSATISGDLTVDTSTLKVDSTNNRVGIGTASPATILDIQSAGGVFARIQNTTSTADAYLLVKNTTGEGFFGINALGPYIYTASALPIVFTTATFERYRIAGDGVATWSNVGGVAGTAMTLNSTGLGVGVTPSYRIHAAVATGSDQNIARFQITGASNGLTIKWNNTTSKMIVNFADCPTSPTGLSSGDLWIDTTAGNTLKVA
jgi:hypothetical protein